MTPQQFRQFADLLSEPALLVDGDGMILDVNRVFRAGDLQTAGDVCGQPLREIVDSDAERVDQYLRACARQHDVVIGALAFKRAGGEPVRFRCQGGAICARTETEPAQILIRLFSRDVSNAPFEAVNLELAKAARERYAEALRRSADELAKSKEALEQSNIELKQFAYIASHDLQSPLRAVAGFAQFLQQDYHGQLDEKADERIERIVDGCQRMQAMINDLLAYSRVESRSRPFQSADLNTVFDDAVAILSSSIIDSGGEVTRGELPTVKGDPSQLTQLLQNLIGNGLKYQSREAPCVTVAAKRNGSEWIIAVRDNGIGIDAPHHERIFEIFRRLHTQDEFPGTGIGLAVCRRIVGRHGGRIWLESEVGKGTTFYFTIAERK